MPTLMKDSDAAAIRTLAMAAQPGGSKYDRLIAKAKSASAATTIVVHPCDETSLRGPRRGGRDRHHRADSRRTGSEDHRRRSRAQARHRKIRDRRCAPQRCRRRKGGRADPPGQGRAADEGQPAHRRAHAGRHRIEQPACAPRGGSATSSSWTCRPTPRRCSSPTPPSTSSPISTPSATSSRTRSISSRRSASARPGSRSSPPSRP